MFKVNSKQHIIQNLRDADCDQKVIEDILQAVDKGCKNQALALLAEHRQLLLEQFHHSKYCIDCLDYLVVQIEKM